MINTSSISILAVVLALGFAVLKAKDKSTGDGPKVVRRRFKRKAFLTQNEQEFLCRLEDAVPELRFHARVAMGSLLDPAAPRTENEKEFFRLRGMFSQKMVDFVAQSRNGGNVVAIIELNDRTHDASKDAKRDSMLSNAGYKIIRWQSRMRPSPAAIRYELLGSMSSASNSAFQKVA